MAPGIITAQFLKENFLDKGRRLADMGRFLRESNWTFDGPALLLMMQEPDLNTSGAAWDVAAKHIKHGGKLPGAYYSDSWADTTITPEEYAWAEKQAEDLGLPGQVSTRPDPVDLQTGQSKMGHYAAGLLYSKHAPLPDQVFKNAVERAATMGSTTSTEGIARRLASGELNAAQRRHAAERIGWPQLLGQRGSWPDQRFNNVLGGGSVLSPEEVEQAYEQIWNAAERELAQPSADELKREEPSTALDALLQTAPESFSKQQFSEIINRKHPVFRLPTSGSHRNLALVAVQKTPYPEHHQAILDDAIAARSTADAMREGHADYHDFHDLTNLLSRNPHYSPAEFLPKVFEAGFGDAIAARAFGRLDEVPGLADKLHAHAIATNNREMARDLVRNEVVRPEQIEELVQRFPSLRADMVDSGAQWLNPNMFADHKVQVAFGTNKLRQARDYILSKGKTELHPREMPPGDWSVGRTKSGNISAAALQAAIDKAPRIPYNVTHGKWDGGQQHSDDPSRVFQLNVTNDQVAKLKAEGLWDKFQNMYNASKHSGHPVGPAGIGWVRWTGGKDGIFVDEVQSDFGQSFIRQAAQQAREQGLDDEQADEVADRAEREYGSDDEYQRIKDILFGGKHPSEVLQEAFHEWLRTPHKEMASEISRGERVGECHNEYEPDLMVDYRGTPIHIWQPESKAVISLSRHNEDDKLPGHFYVGYRDVPSKKMGLKPGYYGELKTQKNTRYRPVVNREGPKYMRGSNVEVKPGAATWKDEVRKSEDQRDHRPNRTFAEHDLPGQLRAEGYKLNIGHMPGVSVATVHRHGRVIGHVSLVDWEPREEWKHEPRAGLRDAVIRVLVGHAKGEQERDGWNEVLPGPQPLKKSVATLRPKMPAGFHATPEGHQVTAPHPTYAHAAAAKPKGAEAMGGKNIWVRPHHEPTNACRTLMVQFSSDLLQGNRQKDHSDAYYDNLYSKREGYHRPDDWWEVPQWQAHIAHSLPNTDHYTVRDPQEAAEFIRQAGYKNIAFSSLDVTAPFIKQLAAAVPNQHIVVGGYTDMNMYREHPNVAVHPTVESFVQSEGQEYKPGYDYRHFNGVKVIPRLTLSDGCRHNCTFCCVPKKVVEVPMSTVEQQADAFGKDLHADLIYLNDKTFGQAPNHAELPRLFQRIKAQNPGFKGFVVQTTAAQMKRMTPQFLRDAGIRHVELGIESFNDPILRAHKKPANEAIIEEAAQKIRQAGASLIPNIMVGLPGEDEHTYGRTMDWLKRNSDIISHVNAYNLALYEDSELGKTLQAVNAADRDENQQVKSWMVNPEVHKRFSEKLFQFANEQLDKPIGHGDAQVGQDPNVAVTKPLAASELPANLEMVGLLSTKGGNAHREMGELVPSMMAKAEDPNPLRAASILVFNEHGQVLWGRRQKDGKWTLPGGHLEAGEEPAAGAIRELHEEAGLTPESVYHFGTANTPDGIPVFMFQAHVHDQTPHAGFDPDAEVAEWRWVDCMQGLPPDIAQNLAHKRNVVVEHMGWTQGPTI